MLADLPRLFEDVDVFFADLRVGLRRVVLINQLRQAQRAGHPCGPAADDDHIGRHLRTLDTFNRFAEDQHFDLIVLWRPRRIVVDRNNSETGRSAAARVNPDFSTADHDSLPITEQLRDLLLRDEAPCLRVESDVAGLKSLIFVSQCPRLAFHSDFDRKANHLNHGSAIVDSDGSPCPLAH